jgi:hypothetical protein
MADGPCVVKFSAIKKGDTQAEGDLGIAPIAASLDVGGGRPTWLGVQRTTLLIQIIVRTLQQTIFNAFILPVF